jgi:hypothetical protein
MTFHTSTVESAFSLFNRGIMGAFHKLSLKHLWAEYDKRKSAKAECLISPSDPQIFMEYSWRAACNDGITDTVNPPVTLFNRGTGAAVNVQIADILVRNWRGTFAPVPYVRGGAQAVIAPSILYGQGEIEMIGLIVLLRPTANAGMSKSQNTPARITYEDANADKFVSEYEFRWDHRKRECVAVPTKLRKLTAAV